MVSKYTVFQKNLIQILKRTPFQCTTSPIRWAGTTDNNISKLMHLACYQQVIVKAFSKTIQKYQSKVHMYLTFAQQVQFQTVIPDKHKTLFSVYFSWFQLLTPSSCDWLGNTAHCHWSASLREDWTTYHQLDKNQIQNAVSPKHALLYPIITSRSVSYGQRLSLLIHRSKNTKGDMKVPASSYTVDKSRAKQQGHECSRTASMLKETCLCICVHGMNTEHLKGPIL